ncbi:hypothetical protein E3E11_00160 [Oecophyllibacter saccharovorans]|uniref:hypothetical protein n=1 Tax=Oecophyllibacter saccharovorans TaxID=2558360 RepID=UPI0011415C76|nr:hypothetical protein [Oecophyllibacter saccharovorans]QDH14538.1 hypothetical protein E3E11_00160 [Oecophyllibacter saccharovorans]
MKRAFYCSALSAVTLPGRLGILCSLAVLAGCGSARQPWNDPHYADAMETGRSVFDLGQMGQAAGQYRLALQRAFIADDAREIHDAGFNLATAELRAGNPQGALKTLDRVEQALLLRHWPLRADLHLVRAAAYLKLGNWEGACQQARLAQKAPDPATVSAALVMEGLAEGQLGDLQGVTAVLAQLQHVPEGSVLAAGVQEVQALQAYLSHQWMAAITLAGKAAAGWRTEFDYGDMRRALSLEARALDASGDTDGAARLQTVIEASRNAEAASQK